jgi:hypothetical protein
VPGEEKEKRPQVPIAELRRDAQGLLDSPAHGLLIPEQNDFVSLLDQLVGDLGRVAGRIAQRIQPAAERVTADADDDCHLLFRKRLLRAGRYGRNAFRVLLGRSHSRQNQKDSGSAEQDANPRKYYVEALPVLSIGEAPFRGSPKRKLRLPPFPFS